MASASYAGVSLGVSLQMRPAAHEPAKQINEYPGVNGLEVIHLGTRGGETTLSGRLYAPTPAGLAVAEQTFRDLQNGAVNVLVDTLGLIWPNVRLEEFQPAGRIQLDPTIGYTRRYEARFLHLS